MIAKINCEIVYYSETQSIVGTDPITDEPIFDVSTTEDKFFASLEKDTVEATFGLLKGKDITEHFYSGKAALKPSEMPAWYTPGSNLEVRFTNGFTAKGYVYYSHPGRLGLDDFFGTTLEIILNY